MSRLDQKPPGSPWDAWRARSRAAADARWQELEKVADKLVRQRKGKQWLADTKQYLVELGKLEILQPYESGRIAIVGFEQLANADQDRLRPIKEKTNLFAFALSKDHSQPDQRLAERSLAFSPSARLRDGQLSLQVFIDDDRSLPIGMNIQLRGTDPTRGRPTYIRYDLDAVAMGASMGPVTHFNAHWHTGDDPDAKNAEEIDPRLPTLILDPTAVLEFLVEKFYPNGPADLS